MRIVLSLLPFAILTSILAAVPSLQDMPQSLDPVFRSLAELPLVAGAIWLVVKLQDKQDAQVERIMAAFASRDERKDAAHQKMADELLETIRELTKRTPHQ